MKKSIFVLILALCLKIQLSSQVNVKYPIEAGSVEYSMSMMGSESTMTLYFEDFGNTQCSDAKVSMFGVNAHNRNIMKGKQAYALDMNTKTYTERELTDEEIKKQAYFLTDEAALKEEGITKLEDEDFLGKPCQVYSMNKDGADVKFWSWQGLMLKMETITQGMTISLIAKAINETTPDQSWYQVPDDFTTSENTEE